MMIVVKIMGGLGNQIAQYAFGRCCADRLGVPLKLDITGFQNYPLHAYGLDRFILQAETATDAEITKAQACGILHESSLLFDFAIPLQIRDGIYLNGYWGDYRYSSDCLPKLRDEFQPLAPLHTSNLALLVDIQNTESVSLHIRRGDYVTNPNCVVMPLSYYEDALQTVIHRIPNAHVYVFSDDLEWAEAHLHVPCPHTFVHGNDASRNVDDFELMRACQHHIVANSTFSGWAAMLDRKGGLVVVPQQYFQPGDSWLIQAFGRVTQPVWPPSWISMPVRKPSQLGNPYLKIAGGRSSTKSMRIGVWNYYEELTTNGFIFKNTNASIGHNLLKPWCDLYAYGQAHGIDFVTLDQTAGPEELDAVIFQDRPRMDNPMVIRLLNTNIVKYLYLFETEVIKPDNWDITFHALFDRVFTWSDTHVDHHHVIKQNFSIDPESPYDFEVLKTAFHQRKLCTLIAGAKGAKHPNELYSERIKAIQWFQTHAPEDFDLYGIGWSAEHFPSYRGAVQDKLATLARYRFAICFENAQNYPGYITEKILDCFRAGVVPVYLGAPNIGQWVPRNCFIDRRDFHNEQSLYTYLSTMSPNEHDTYLDGIQNFLASPKVYPFTTECFIATLTNFIAWDVQTQRGEIPDLAQHRGTEQGGLLMQDSTKFTVRLEENLQQAPSPMNQTHAKPATSPQTLVIEGWRGINHSFALVNQFQLLEMAHRQDLTLRHVDAPFHFAHWNRATSGAGFHAKDEAILSAIPSIGSEDSPGWTFRIFSPIDLRPPSLGGKLAVFLVTELGLDEQSFVAGSNLKQFESDGNLIITPSHWSRDRIIDWGFQPATVRVISHAASPEYFFPLPEEVNRKQRIALGFNENDVILLNIGAAIWNKGIDVLLKGFALARQKRKDLRLIFKDQRNTYGINGETFVQSTLAAVGLLTDDVINAITLIPANLTMAQMNSIYGMADCYVSAYRAEGFNLPVCEAMACGTPVVVTAGGATDDFVQGAGHRRINSTLHRNVVIQDKNISAYCEPDLEHLVEILMTTEAKVRNPIAPPSTTQGWGSPVNQLLALLT